MKEDVKKDLYNTWLCKSFIAHRGLHTDEFPENSMSAFQNAIDNNCAIEIDVQPLKDGTVVIFHDDFLDRMTKSKGDLLNFTYEEIKKIKFLGSNEGIPTLKEFLDFVDGKVPVLVEIKNSKKKNFAKDVYDILKDYKGEYAIQSFNPLYVAWFKKHASHVARGQLADLFLRENMNGFVRFFLKRMSLNRFFSKPDFVAYNSDFIPNRWVKKYKGKKPVLAWYVRSQDEYERISKHVDNIIFEFFKPTRIKQEKK